MRFKDLTGLRFGYLVVISRAEDRVDPNGRRRVRWLCKCDCGNTVIVVGEHIKSGRTKSCGCFQKQLLSEKMKTHGDRHTPLYAVWCAMKARCYNKNSTYFSHYGARGITVCDAWRKDYAAFKNWAEHSGYNRGLTIDRIDVNGNYCPENCRWVSIQEQANNRRSNINITYCGQTHNLMEWSKLLNIKYGKLHQRLKAGWNIDRAFTTP